MKNAEEYADIIMRDEREKIARETPTVYDAHRVERLYEFADGAVVKYEWQKKGSRAAGEKPFNHRFSLVALPSPNPRKFKKGVIKTIDFS